MEKFLDTKYKLARAENFDKLFAEIGVNTFMRKIQKSKTSTAQLVLKGDDRYAFHTTVLKVKTQTLEFTLDEEFEEKTMDGRKVKSKVTFDDNKMIHTQQLGEKELIVERRFFNDEMVEIYNYGDIVCTCWWKAVK